MINPDYAAEKIQVRELLMKQGSVVLNDILTEEWYIKLSEELSDLTFVPFVQPDVYSLEMAMPSTEITILMNELASYIGGEIDSISVRRYKHGSYVLRNDQQSHLVHLVLFFVAAWDDSYRGEFTYVPENDVVVYFYPVPNSLAIVDCEDKQKFVKRINYLAGDASFVTIEALVKLSI